jgi:hypothetical protein
MRAKIEILFFKKKKKRIYVIMVSAYFAEQKSYGSYYSLRQKGQKDK